jgi:hypothetical protein
MTMSNALRAPRIGAYTESTEITPNHLSVTVENPTSERKIAR